MTNAPHKHKAKLIRGIPEEEVEAFDAAVAGRGSNRSAVTRELWAWFAGKGELPRRPARADTAMIRKIERQMKATNEHEREAAQERRTWAAAKEYERKGNRMVEIHVVSTDRVHTGRAWESIARTVWGRNAEIRLSNKIGDGVYQGEIVRPAPKDQGAFDVLAKVVFR